MEPQDIVQAVHSSTVTVKNWLDGTDKKSDEVIANLSAAINLLYNTLGILCPLPVLPVPLTILPVIATTLKPKVLASLLGIGEALSLAKDHLSIWKDTRLTNKKEVGIIDGTAVKGWLRDDEKLLMRLVGLVLRSLDTVPKIRPEFPGTGFGDIIRNETVKEFWRDEIGEEVVYVPRSTFCAALRKWMRDDIDDLLLNALSFCLDEYAVGGATPSSLDAFVGERPMKVAIEHFQTQEEMLPRKRHLSLRRRSTAQPWLLWVDDVPSDNVKEIIYAEEASAAKVFTFPSTASLKIWVKTHESQLRERDRIGSLRFISNNNRWELDARWQRGSGVGSSFLDLSAGETMLRFLRGRNYRAPVLVYCDVSLPSTRYVVEYENAGSTRSLGVVRMFISGLEKDTEDDYSWQAFGATINSLV